MDALGGRIGHNVKRWGRKSRRNDAESKRIGVQEWLFLNIGLPGKKADQERVNGRIFKVEVRMGMNVESAKRMSTSEGGVDESRVEQVGILKMELALNEALELI